MASELRVDRIVPVDGVSAGSGNSPGTSFVGGGGVIQVQMGASTDIQTINDKIMMERTVCIAFDDILVKNIYQNILI